MAEWDKIDWLEITGRPVWYETTGLPVREWLRPKMYEYHKDSLKVEDFSAAVQAHKLKTEMVKREQDLMETLRLRREEAEERKAIQSIEATIRKHQAP